jgi:hypothetical protein
MFEHFESWDAVLEMARATEKAFVYYKAPLDHSPRLVRVVKVYKNRKVRVDPCSWDADTPRRGGHMFTADSSHLDRFVRRRVCE